MKVIEFLKANGRDIKPAEDSDTDFFVKVDGEEFRISVLVGRSKEIEERKNRLIRQRIIPLHLLPQEIQAVEEGGGDQLSQKIILRKLHDQLQATANYFHQRPILERR